VLVAGYSTPQQDAEALQAVEWGNFILDAAQFIKNANAQRTRAALALRTGMRVAATGRPVENHADDLYSLFQFIQLFPVSSSARCSTPNNDTRAGAARKSAGPSFVRARIVAVDANEKRAARRSRAEKRRVNMTVEVSALGQPKPPPYARHSPTERLAAATQLIAYHQAIRGAGTPLERSEWPGETFVITY
jgi:hypothetical protein